MDQTATISANPVIPVQPVMSQEHVWHLENGVEQTLTAQVTYHEANQLC